MSKPECTYHNCRLLAQHILADWSNQDLFEYVLTLKTNELMGNYTIFLQMWESYIVKRGFDPKPGSG